MVGRHQRLQSYAFLGDQGQHPRKMPRLDDKPEVLSNLVLELVKCWCMALCSARALQRTMLEGRREKPSLFFTSIICTRGVTLVCAWLKERRREGELVEVIVHKMDHPGVASALAHKTKQMKYRRWNPDSHMFAYVFVVCSASPHLPMQLFWMAQPQNISKYWLAWVTGGDPQATARET